MWLSDLCDGRSCTDQEIRTVERIVTRYKEFKKEIGKSIFDATGIKKVSRTLQPFFGSVGFGLGGYGIYRALRRRNGL